MKNYKKGKLAELAACIYLILCGYHFVCRNYISGRGTHAGEIDLIMQKHHTLAFVEVKQRGNLTKAAYAISPMQQQRLWRGAESFLQKHPQYQGFDVRFDAVLIHFPWQIKHIPNAWRQS